MSAADHVRHYRSVIWYDDLPTRMVWWAYHGHRQRAYGARYRTWRDGLYLLKLPAEGRPLPGMPMATDQGYLVRRLSSVLDFSQAVFGPP